MARRQTKLAIVKFTTAPVRPASDRMTAQQRRNLKVNNIRRIDPLSK